MRTVPRRPVLVYADEYSEGEIVNLMRAGAADCVRRGDLVRLRVAVERELEGNWRGAERPQAPPGRSTTLATATGP